jgi:Flp pilus assembly protein TadD
MCRVVALLLASFSSLLAADEWVRLTTPHFELYTTAGEKRGREAILYFEEVRSFFTESSPSKKAPEFPVRIIAFKGEKPFKPYNLNDFATAYYAPSRSRDYIVMQDLEQEHFPVAIHEYMHLIVQHAGLKIPLWLNEGLADVYSTLKPRAKQAMIGDLIPGRVYTLSNEKWMSLDALTSVQHDSADYNERNRAGIFYAESWALTHMLYLDPRYAANFGKFLAAVHGGQSFPEAVHSAYGKGEGEIAKDLQTYLHRNQLFGALFPVKLTKSEEEAESAPVSTFDSDVVLADLLAATNKYDQARAAYERLDKQSAGRPEIAESLGYLSWQKQDRNGARKYFRESMTAGSQDAQMCFHLGMLDREMGEPYDTYAPAFQKAIELKSDYVDAHIELARSSLNAQNWSAAVIALSSLKTVPEERAAEFFSELAYGYLRLGQYADARVAVTNAKKWQKEPEDVQRNDQILHYLDDRDAAEKRRTERPPAAPVIVAENATPLPESAETSQPAAPAQAADGSEAATGFGTHNPFVKPGELLKRAEGVAKNIDCSGKFPRFQLLVESKLLTLDMPEPERIWLRHPGSDTFEFRCGPQKAFPVAVEYVPSDKPGASAGVLRQMEF